MGVHVHQRLHPATEQRLPGGRGLESLYRHPRHRHGSTKKHKVQAKLTVPNWMNVDTLYGQLVARIPAWPTTSASSCPARTTLCR